MIGLLTTDRGNTPVKACGHGLECGVAAGGHDGLSGGDNALSSYSVRVSLGLLVGNPQDQKLAKKPGLGWVGATAQEEVDGVSHSSSTSTTSGNLYRVQSTASDTSEVVVHLCFWIQVSAVSICGKRSYGSNLLTFGSYIEVRGIDGITVALDGRVAKLKLSSGGKGIGNT